MIILFLFLMLLGTIISYVSWKNEAPPNTHFPLAKTLSVLFIPCGATASLVWIIWTLLVQ